MYNETLLSDRKKVEIITRSDSVSSMYLLPGHQVLLSRFITAIAVKGAILPPLDNILVVIHLGGKQVTGQGDTLIVSTPNNITFVPPSDEMPCQFQGSADFVALLIAGKAKKRVLGSVMNDRKIKFSDAMIPAIARQLTAESVRTDRDEAYCDCLMETILHHLIYLLRGNQAQRVDTDSLHSQQIQKAINYIHQNLSTPLTVNQLAQIVELHPSWFPQLFKRVTGMTVRRYVMRQRLERAHDLLVNTDMNLLQLADETGFSSQSHFTESFKKVYEVTPLQYRKSL